MPDYDLSEQSAVKLTIHGGVVDQAYSRLLIQKTDLPLHDILALDRIQKKLPVPKEIIAHLRKAGLVEGRKPNVYVSAKVASTMSAKAGYIKTRAQDDEFYIKLLTDYLKKFKKASRLEIDNLLMDKLSDALDETQKRKKIENLLTKLRRGEVIMNQGSRAKSEWVLVSSKSAQ
jgi:ATP-dependent DNA helicase RecG